MGIENLFHYLNLTLEVFVINLLLSGDNAVVIALACRAQPPELMRRAMMIGIGAAILLRIVLTTFASLLLHVPLLKLVGGTALTIIAIKLTIAKSSVAQSDEFSSENRELLWSTVGTIIAADLVMSVDNVVALAAVAQGNILFLALGLLMCVPLLIYGSVFVTALLKRYPLLIRGGGAMLGWIAGDLAISDPVIAPWVNQQSPALTVVVPILVVVFVLFESRIMEEARAGGHALRPSRKPRPPPAISPFVVVEHTAAKTAANAETVATAGTISAADGAAAPPREKNSKLSLWIIVIIVLALLLILFKFLSLDFTSTAPAIQFTRPTGGG